MTVEKELEKIAKYLNIKIDCSFTDDGVIQMKAGKNNLIGFASILNKIHNDRYKNNKEQSSKKIKNLFFPILIMLLIHFS